MPNLPISSMFPYCAPTEGGGGGLRALTYNKVGACVRVEDNITGTQWGGGGRAAGTLLNFSHFHSLKLRISSMEGFLNNVGLWGGGLNVTTAPAAGSEAPAGGGGGHPAGRDRHPHLRPSLLCRWSSFFFISSNSRDFWNLCSPPLRFESV